MDVDVKAGAAGAGAFDPGSLSAFLAESQAIAFAAIRDGHVVFANPAFGTLFRREATCEGLPLRDLFVPADHARLSNRLDAAGRSSETFAGRALCGDGTSFDTELHLARESIDGRPTIVAFAEDITRRNRSEIQLSYLAYSDPLTGLPNRALLADRLGQEMRASRRDGHGFAVLMADLDGFKAVNDTWGHGAGDTVLQLLAQRFLACTRDSDTLARLGGDEFGVLLPRLRAPEDAEHVAARLVQDARRPVELDGHNVRIGVSVGIARFPDHADSVDALLAAADGALYRAKREGRSRYAWAATLLDSASNSLPLIRWSVAHEIGVREIDAQHAQLAALLNEVASSLRNGHLGDATLGRLADVIRLAEFHFATEERLMAEHSYRGSVPHRDMHYRLLADIRTLAADSDFRSVSLTTRYLQEWLLRHVDGMDKHLGRALRDRGVR